MDRRTFLAGALLAGAGSCTGGPLLRIRSPHVTHGIQAGDVATGTALLWARCDEPARLVVEWDTTDRFARPRRVAGPVVGPAGDGAATVAVGPARCADRV